MEEVGFKKENIVGKSINGAGNMRGIFYSLKWLIEKECDTMCGAVYIDSHW